MYLYLYTHHEIPFLADFHDEHKNIGQNYKQYIRIFGLGLMSINYLIFARYYYPEYYKLLFAFTNWTLFVTTCSIYSSYCAANDKVNFGSKPVNEKSYNIMARHHLLYTMAIIMNFTVVVVYWGFIHKIDP